MVQLRHMSSRRSAEETSMFPWTTRLCTRSRGTLLVVSPRCCTMRRPCWTVALDPCVVRCATWLSGLLATTRVMFSFPWDSSGRHTEMWEHQLQRGESSRGCGAVGLSMSARVVCTYSSAVRMSSSEISTGTVLLWLVKCTAHSLTVSPASSRQIFWRASCTLWAGVTEALRRTGVALYSMMRVEPSS